MDTHIPARSSLLQEGGEEATGPPGTVKSGTIMVSKYMWDMGGKEGPRGSCPIETERSENRYEEKSDVERGVGKMKEQGGFVCVNFVLFLIGEGVLRRGCRRSGGLGGELDWSCDILFVF